MRGQKLMLHGIRLPVLGQGDSKKVFVHPHRPDLVFKLLPRSEQVWQEVRRSALILAREQIGPPFFAVISLGEEKLAVQERVFGETINALSARGAFGEEEFGLVDELLHRCARHRIEITDPHLSNIMIGTTASDPMTQRAFMVDGELVMQNDRTEKEVLSLLKRRPVKLERSFLGEGPLEIHSLEEELYAAFDRSSRRRWLRVLFEKGLSRLRALFSHATFRMGAR